MNGLKPCELLTDAQKTTFGIDRPPQATNEPTFDSPNCSMRDSNTNVSFGITTVTTMGIDRFQAGKVRGEVISHMTAGFPGVEIRTDISAAGTTDFCTVVTDVADGQVLHVDYTESGVQKPLGKDELCRRAGKVAETVLTNLLAK